MEFKEILDFLLKLLDLITKWPVIILSIIIIFRDKVEFIITELSKRITSISVANTQVNFDQLRSFAATSNPELVKATLLRLADSQEIIEEETDEMQPKIDSINEFHDIDNFIKNYRK